MNQENQNICYENFSKFLEECGLKGKTLTHYPDAVDKYIPKYIRKYIDPNFDSFYDVRIEDIRDLYNQLEKSNYWEQEIKYKTWKLRLKAIEYFISFKEKYGK